jgi:hypothetical protein
MDDFTNLRSAGVIVVQPLRYVTSESFYAASNGELQFRSWRFWGHSQRWNDCVASQGYGGYSMIHFTSNTDDHVKSLYEQHTVLCTTNSSEPFVRTKSEKRKNKDPLAAER